MPQAPAIVQAALGILHGARLFVDRDDAGLVRRPVPGAMSRAIDRSLSAVRGGMRDDDAGG
jgi:hypothetical protein